jgi:hypothetical protein
MEGALLGVNAVAVSLAGPPPHEFRDAARFAAALARQVVARPPPAPVLLNVNVPPGPVRGYRFTRLGRRTYGNEVVEKTDPRGRKYYWIGGEGRVHNEDIPGSDCNAVLLERLAAVTPLHLASAYAALVNGGIWRPATMVKLGDKAPPQGRRVFKASTSARMRQLLRLIVTDGTGKQADAPGFRVGGKTGSAEKPGVGGYRRSSVVATFAAAFPMDNPRYVIVAMVDEPKGNAYGSGQRTAGWTAAPVVRKVVMRAGPMLGVFPDESRDVDVSELIPLVRRDEETQ